MKNIILLTTIITALALTGCVASGTSSGSQIAQARGQNASLLTDAELAQYQKQRVNEVSEANAQAAKNRAATDSTRSTINTISDGVGLARDLKNLFGL